MTDVVEYPEWVMLRDTMLHDDMGGLGQRIYTSAGGGYTKQKYIRADVVESLRQQLAEANRKYTESVGGFKRDLQEKLDQQRNKNKRLEEQFALVQKRMDWEADRAAKLDVALEDAQQQLAECQAKVQKYRGDIASYIAMEQGEDAAADYIANQPSDSTALDTMLKAAKREALLDAATEFEECNPTAEIARCSVGDELRRMAKELE